jgi:hypothetical protein
MAFGLTDPSFFGVTGNRSRCLNKHGRGVDRTPAVFPQSAFSRPSRIRVHAAIAPKCTNEKPLAKSGVIEIDLGHRVSALIGDS